MQSQLLSHSLTQEFPELADKVRLLKTTDAHFVHQLAEHDALDAQITKSETGIAPLDDVLMENLKKQRLHLKDALYQRVQKAV